MGSRKSGIERVDAKTGQQAAGINELLTALQGLSPELFSNLGSNIQDQPIYQQAVSQLGEQIGAGFDPTQVSEAFNLNVADPARQTFQDQVLPAIQERLGRSSATANTALKGALDLEKQLGAGLSQELLNQQRASTQAQQNAISQALGFAQAPQTSNLQDINALLSALGLGTGTDLFALKQTPGSTGLGSTIGALAGGGLGYLAGVPGIGASVGAGVGSQF